jgi:hypothetical protein
MSEVKDTRAEVEENRFVKLRREYEAELNEYLWFRELDDFVKEMMLTKMAGSASDTYHSGWHKGYSEAQRIYSH